MKIEFKELTNIGIKDFQQIFRENPTTRKNIDDSIIENLETINQALKDSIVIDKVCKRIERIGNNHGKINIS